MESIKKIAVIYGGSSSEREISVQSGEGIHAALNELGYVSSLVDFRNLQNISSLCEYDFIFIALHGFEGEGGALQKNLDDLNIPYSGSAWKACSNTWSKKLTKEILNKNGINTPKSINLKKFSKEIAEGGLNNSFFDPLKPFDHLFLKPDADGSSVDIFKIGNDENLENAYEVCTNHNRNYIFEEYIEGRELTVTIINKECFPPIEIITKNEFYDYHAKYISDETLHIEANLSSSELIEIKKISAKAFELLGCKAWARVDLLQDKDNNFYIIEINTVPGMTEHSCVPKSGGFLGISYNEIVKMIIDASI